MLTIPGIPVARLGGVTLSLLDFLRDDHRRGRLLLRLQAAVREVLLIEKARALGLGVAGTELQHAADLFRRRRNLSSAADTHAWLHEGRMTLDDLETVLTDSLLLQKLKDHVGREGVPSRFQQRPADYDRIKIRLIQVAEEDLARELHTQIVDEGASFEAFARSHSTHASRQAGGLVGPLFRLQYPALFQPALAQAEPEPFSDASGSYLLAVQERIPATLDRDTATFIAQEVYEEWLAKTLADAPFSAPLLDFLQ